MRINAKLLINIIVPVVTTLVVILIIASNIRSRNEAERRNRFTENLRSELSELNSRTYYYLLHGEQRARNEWFSIFESLSAIVEDMKFGDADQDAIVQRVRHNLDEMRELFVRRIRLDAEPASSGAARSREKLELLAAQVLTRAGYVESDAHRLYEAGSMARRSYSARANTLILLLLAASVLITLATLLPVNRAISRSIAKLTAGSEIIGSGNLDHRIGLDARDELGDLARAFDKMAASLKETTVSRDELAAEIAERKRVEQALKQNQQFLETIIENAPACVKLVDADGKLTKMNRAGLSTLRADSPDQVQGKSIYPLVAARDRPAFMRLTTDVFAGKSGSLDFEAIDLKGKHLWLSTRAVPLYDDSGKVWSLLGITVDITDRKHAEQQLTRLLAELERSNRELEQFAYVASHDLQEPLRMVASYVQLLERRYKGHLDEKADKYIFYAVDGVQRMQKLIEGLLAYSRVTRGSEFGVVDVNTAFSQALHGLQIAIRESGAQVTCDPLPRVIGNEMQLSQLFQNLIANAIKFKKAGVSPQVNVSASKAGGDWIFSVRDNGIGFDPAQAERIFLIFQRLHDRDEYPGTGIGLALCKRIVEHHHGRIWAESAPNEGAAFFFTMPEMSEG